MRCQRHLAVVSLVAVQLAGVAPVAAQFRKGLSQATTEVVLTRRRPPDVLILGTAIKVEVVSQADGRDSTASRFKTALEGQLLANDARLRTGQAEPDTIISCAISRLETRQTPGMRQVQVTRQVGTKQVWNEKKKAYETQPNYQLVKENEAFVTVTGDLAVTLQVRDRKSSAALDSRSFTPAYEQEFKAGNTPPSNSEVEQQLLDTAVVQVAQRLTPTREPLKVMLARPNDPIDGINKLGQAGQWTGMLEQLQLMQPLKDPKKEAYRLHNLGVANEAIAYNTQNLATSRKLLEEAAGLYRKAIAMKPDEKYFLTPQGRITESLAGYAELDRQHKVIAEAEAAAPASPAPAATPAAPPAPSATAGPARSAAPASGAPAAGSASKAAAAFDNADLVDLVAAGLDEQNLLAAIKDADKVAFDLSPAGLKQLLAGKVPNAVITAMRARQTAQSAPPKKSSPPRLENPKPPPGAKPPAATKPPGRI